MKLQKYPEFTLLALTVVKPHVIVRRKDETETEAYLLRVDAQGEIYFYAKEERIQLAREDQGLFFKRIGEGITKNRFDFHYEGVR